jgi:geranyl-CoA carboxylase alpha subunit
VKRLLIANRGEIALRIASSARGLGLEIVAVYSDADAGAPHVREADYAERLGPAEPSASYLDIDAVLRAALATGADAVHPGYGFLAESPEFAERCVGAGLTFVGPPASAMRALGNKASSKRLLAGSNVPFLPGYHAEDQSDEAFVAAAAEIGYPLMVKASAGGGGRGMRLVTDGARLSDSLRSARSEAAAAFGNGDLLLERALFDPRHIEVQIFADAFGNVVHLGERDCSVQRRHQKLIEEAPSPAVDAALRERLGAVAVEVARAADYVGAGTVEFLLDSSGAFYFIEMNTRLQVEHPVTEAIFGEDLVEWQLRVARGERLPRLQDELRSYGHALEARLCAEDPARDFLPQSGTLVAWKAPFRIRVEHALESGIVLSPYYDSMIAKLIARGANRDEARLELIRGLEECVAFGIPTNRAALIAYLRDERFIAGAATTRFIEERQNEGALEAEAAAPIVALAAALLFVRATALGGFGSWTAWSTSHLPGATITLSIDDGAARSISLAVHGANEVTATIDGSTLRVAIAPLERGSTRTRYRIEDGPWRPLEFAESGPRTFFECEGRTFAVTDRGGELAASALAGGPGDGFLRAPMSGRVVTIAAAGEVVKAGTSLVVLEAMKMEHVLALPVDAALREVTAAVGLQVHANDILLTYEPVTVP